MASNPEIARKATVIIIQIFSIIVGLLLISLGVLTFTGILGRFIVHVQTIVITSYVILFGLLIIIFTLFFPYPLLTVFGFYAYWGGRGLFFIFLGGLVVSGHWLNIVTTCILAVLGILFIIFQFIPIIPPLSPLIPLVSRPTTSSRSDLKEGFISS